MVVDESCDRMGETSAGDDYGSLLTRVHNIPKYHNKICDYITHTNMSLVAHYKLNDPSALTTDSVGSFHLTNVNGVVTVTDATYGTVASFVQSSVPEEVQYLHTTVTPSAIGGNSSRTYSSWVRPTGTDLLVQVKTEVLLVQSINS